MKKLLLALLVSSAVTSISAQTYKYPFQNPNLSVEERTENLISLLTPEEKVGLMMNKAISVDRLGIPSINWWNEACHGVRQTGYTVYPQPIGMASAFDTTLVYNVFTQVSDEARANWNRSADVWNVPMGVTNYPGNPELTYWCPNVNIFRDPRWGRGQESCGEDPYMNAVLGVQTVKGMQGNDPKYYKTHACAKHYAVHSGPEMKRHQYNASVSMRDLWETYLPAFKALVKKGNVREVMCAYNRYEGEPCCMNDRLLINILRQKWGYDGIILTDCDAINNFFNKNQHHTHETPLAAATDAVLHGTDLECGRVFAVLADALKQGLVSEADLDAHLRRTLSERIKLGMFDPREMLPWAKIGPDQISNEEHNALAEQAARESMVMLKNSGVLPIAKTTKTIAVVGPNADDATMMNGEYGGSPTPEHTHTILDGIKAAYPDSKIIYRKACELDRDYQTESYLSKMNDGKGAKVEFFENNNLEGTPAKVDYCKEMHFSTFGAYGFTEGISSDSISLRLSGSFVADYTGDMSYTLSSDNGYVLTVNGQVIANEKAAPMMGFGRRMAPAFKTFKIEKGKTYDVVLEYKRSLGRFAMLNGDICHKTMIEFTDVINDVKDADVIIAVIGLHPSTEGEGGDKADIEIPAIQQKLIRAMHSTGKPVVLVNCSGSCLAFASVADQYDALIQAWYPGQGGAKAIGDILTGAYNPSGKLPVTFYASNNDLPDFEDYSMDNRTYRYFKGTPMYAFGYGLSYTTFACGNAKISAKSMKKDGKVTITIPVKNTGSREGSETVQVYVKALDYPEASIKDLRGFSKVNVLPGKTATATITLDGEAFQYYDASIDELSTRAGKYQILYGTSSLDKDLKAINFEVK